MSTNHFTLPANVELGEYRILRTLGQGGFGITYLAEAIADGKRVVIKENLPAFCAFRNTTNLYVAPTNPNDPEKEYHKLLTRFVEEARLLARLNHPNIVKVYKAFEALGTAYYVMPWIGGTELHKAAPPPHEITEAWLRPILLKLLESLAYLHSRKVYHRDIKPANILLKNKFTPVIIDFGTARSIGGERSATMVGSPGYSPIEQITTHGEQGPWTDIYSLGATCYRIITGSPPPDASERLATEIDTLRPLSQQPNLRRRFSVNLLSTIDKALAIRAKHRWQTADEWLETLITGRAPTSSANTAVPINARPVGAPPINSSPLIAQPRHVSAPKLSSPKRQVLLILLLVILAGSLAICGHIAVHVIRLTLVPHLRVEAAKQQWQLFDLSKQESESEKNWPDCTDEAPPQQAEILQLFQTGENYYYGRNGYTQDYANAARYFRSAAEAGYAEAQYKLGECYEKGRGVTTNYREATAWYLKAAAQGNEDAIIALRNLK